MASDPVSFHPDEDAYDAAQAFERYDFGTGGRQERQVDRSSDHR
jgi:hypothetical protein